MYKCNNCGFVFGEIGIVQINYQESVQKEYVSACCNCTFVDVE